MDTGLAVVLGSPLFVFQYLSSLLPGIAQGLAMNWRDHAIPPATDSANTSF